MFWRLLVSGLASAWLLGAAPVAAAADLWAKAGIVASTMAIELQACTEEAQDVDVEIDLGRTPGRAGFGLDMAFGAGFSAAMRPNAQARYVRECMAGRGYTAIPLSPAEEREIAQLKSPEVRRPWIEAFYSRADFTQRLAAAVVMPPTTLLATPRPQGEPLVYGAFRFDPKALTAVDGVVLSGGSILTGKIAFRQASRVKTDVKAFPINVTGGSVAYAETLVDPHGAPMTYWCGKMKMGLLKSTADYCAWKTGGKYILYSYAFPIGLQNRTEFIRGVSGKAALAFDLDPQPEVAVDRVDFTLVATSVSGGGVSLRAEATSGGEQLGVWVTDLLFDAKGQATLPFWTHQLVLTRSGEGITAAFLPDGDGKGWDDAVTGVPHP